MPLTPLLGDVSYASDASAVTIENTTVYGGANPDRSEVATFVQFYKVDRTGDLTPMSQSPYDPTTDDIYTAALEQDGWIQVWFVNVENYNIATTYAQYDAVYYNGVVYRALQASTGQVPPDLTNWEVIEFPTELIENYEEADESGNLTFLIFDFIASAYSRVYAGNTAALAAIETATNRKRSEDVLDYEFFYTMLDGMVAAGDRNRFAEGERIARKIQDEYAKITA
jgi:hypothetical protein